MLNEIHVEGAVTRTWVYRDVQFARIACRVGPGRVQVSEPDGRPSEYITLRRRGSGGAGNRPGVSPRYGGKGTQASRIE